MRILIADDDPISRRLIERALTQWGFEVVTCQDGSEAWEALQRDDAPQLAILDWMMPGMDGVDVCRRVQQQQGLHPIHILLLTSRGERQDIVAGLEAGAADYMTKPFDAGELRARVNVGARIVQLQTALSERVAELEAALSQVKHLEGLLPICAYCKKIRTDNNYWEQVEHYIVEHSQVQFSHGICPDCFDKYLRPQLEELERQNRSESSETSS